MIPIQHSSIFKKLYFLAVVIANNIIIFTGGIQFVWSAPMFPRLATVNEENPFGRVLSYIELSFLSSCLPLGSMFGPIIAGIMADKIGRKKTLLYFTGIPAIISLITLIFTKSVIVYYVARIITGIGVGNAFVIVPLYLAEISEASSRGKVASTMNISIVFGELVTYVVGPLVSIMTLNLISAVFALLFFITIIFCPESPYHSVAKGDTYEAEITIRKLRDCNSEDVRKELELIKEVITNNEKNKGTIKDIFTDRICRKTFLICLGLFSFQHLSGLSVIVSFSTDIFAASGSSINSDLSSIILGVIQLLGSFVTPIFIDKLGRKILLMISSVGMFLSEFFLGLYFFLKENGYDVTFLNWLPITCMVAYMITFIAGFGAICWIYMGEVLPCNVKAVASTILTCYCSFLAFAISMLFLNLVNWFGFGGTLWIFAVCCFFAFWFTVYFVFETKGKTFQEIQNMIS